MQGRSAAQPESGKADSKRRRDRRGPVAAVTQGLLPGEVVRSLAFALENPASSACPAEVVSAARGDGEHRMSRPARAAHMFRDTARFLPTDVDAVVGATFALCLDTMEVGTRVEGHGEGDALAACRCIRCSSPTEIGLTPEQVFRRHMAPPAALRLTFEGS